MDALEQLTTAVLRLTEDGLNQLIDFLQTEGALESITDKNIRDVALMREGVDFGKAIYFARARTSGSAVAAVLRAAKSPELGLDRVLEVLIDTRDTLGKAPR
jgi:hypothetical protein